MKITKYFEFRRKLPDRSEITDSVIEAVLESPVKTETKDDGRIKGVG